MIKSAVQDSIIHDVHDTGVYRIAQVLKIEEDLRFFGAVGYMDI